MSAGTVPGWSLRIERAEASRLAWALTISLAFHLCLGGGYVLGKKYAARLSWLQNLIKMAQALAPKKPVTSAPPQQREAPLLFVDVSPAQEAAEPPRDAKYYSDRNSRAANPQATIDSDVPKITGKQKDVPRTEDVPRTYKPLQPSPPPPITKAPPAKEPQEELKPKPSPPLGDLAMAKPAPPNPNPNPDTGEAPKPRPKTIAEAKAKQQPDNRLAGEKMKQEGGVRQYTYSGLDVKSTLTGAYDRAFIDAVAQRWYFLIDQQKYASDAQGKVEIQFTLHYDGRITDTDFGDNTVGFKWGLLCEQAIQDPAPYAAWPDDMRRSLGNIRKITFTFFYY